MQMQDSATVPPHQLMPVEAQEAVWLGAPGATRHEIFGEEYNQPHMLRIAATLSGRSDVPVPAWLSPEPGGVIVWAMGARVGYLPPPLAAVWHAPLVALRDGGAAYTRPC